MRQRKTQKKKIKINDKSVKLIEIYSEVTSTRIDTTNDYYRKKMCKGCKYYQDKCTKGLIPVDCARRGEKYK